MGQAQGPLREEAPGVEPSLPRRSTHPTGGSEAFSRWRYGKGAGVGNPAQRTSQAT